MITAEGSNSSENYPGAYNLKFSETKGACDLAYSAAAGEKYLFPDGKIWEIIARKTDASGFLAILLKPENDSRIVLSFAGTQINNEINAFFRRLLSIPNTPPGEEAGDLLTDYAQELGIITRQYRLAAGAALNYKCQYGANLILTGHSLGGGLATYSSLLNKIPTTTINPAPLAESTVLQYISNGAQCVGVPVTNYISGGQEVISSNGLWGIPAGFLERVFPIGTVLPGGYVVRSYEDLVRTGQLPKLLVIGRKIAVAGGSQTGLAKYYHDHLISDTAPEVPLPKKFGKTFGSAAPKPSRFPTPVPAPTPVPTGTPTAR